MKDMLAAARPAQRPSGALDGNAIGETIRHALAAAGLDAQGGPLQGASDIVERTLASVGLMQPGGAPAAFGRKDTEAPGDIDARARGTFPPRSGDAGQRGAATAPGQDLRDASVARSFTNHAGTRSYAVFVPSGYASATDPMPLVVMLHGCTQSASDFAAGTGMNELAEEHGFVVVYPMQSPRANAQKCWSWFRPEDQRRERGEPSIIAGITKEVASTLRIDPTRIFVAGMSAGGAMAVVLGAEYPELYAAVGVHSGVPQGAAHDVASALRVMQAGERARRRGAEPTATHAVPTIVFHGDRDATVNSANGQAIVDDALALHAPHADAARESHEGTTAGGRRFTRTLYLRHDGVANVEHWVLHGAGHAWSGGRAAGSYTDPRGPDASAEMIRFFLASARRQAR